MTTTYTIDSLTRDLAKIPTIPSNRTAFDVLLCVLRNEASHWPIADAVRAVGGFGAVTDAACALSEEDYDTAPQNAARLAEAFAVLAAGATPLDMLALRFARALAPECKDHPGFAAAEILGACDVYEVACHARGLTRQPREMVCDMLAADYLRETPTAEAAE